VQARQLAYYVAGHYQHSWMWHASFMIHHASCVDAATKLAGLKLWILAFELFALWTDNADQNFAGDVTQECMGGIGLKPPHSVFGPLIGELQWITSNIACK